MSIVGETPLLHHTYSTSHEVKTYLSTTLKHPSLHVRAKYGKITSHFSRSRSFSSATRRVLDRKLASRTMQSATYPARRIVSPSRIPHPVSQPKTKSSKTYKTPPPLRPPSTASGPLVPASTYLPLVTEVRGQHSTVC